MDETDQQHDRQRQERHEIDDDRGVGAGRHRREEEEEDADPDLPLVPLALEGPLPVAPSGLDAVVGVPGIATPSGIALLPQTARDGGALGVPKLAGGLADATWWVMGIAYQAADAARARDHCGAMSEAVWLYGLRAALAAAALACAVAGALGCGSLERAAAKDPMRCERDPKCNRKSDRSIDCVTQCVDDPACIGRCRSVSGQR